MAVSEFWAIEQRHAKLLKRVERLERRIDSLEEINAIGDGAKPNTIVDRIMNKPKKKATA
jgi:hypothetical protein|tara:strand:- start:376 stop:555 length:180 start_codon:yes stop_codon:yes gene_type:complete